MSAESMTSGHAKPTADQEKAAIAKSVATGLDFAYRGEMAAAKRVGVLSDADAQAAFTAAVTAWKPAAH